MKNVLVVYYTQSGQLKEIVDSITKPMFNDEELNVSFLKIEMQNDYPFPWNKADFFDVFPESFLQEPAPIKEIDNQIAEQNYDLVILAYQVWYLSPSIPTVSFLKNEQAKKILNNTPIVTVIGCRNMWIIAQEKMKILLRETNAKLVGNIALVDRHINHISVITIVQWMFTGKKEKYLGIFPKPGVSAHEIKEASKFGEIISNELKQSTLDNLQTKLLAKNAIEIRPFLITMDKKANKMFKKWASLIKGSKNRPFLLKLFNIYLLVAIWIISPIVYILHLLTYPLIFAKIKREAKYYKGV